MLKNYEVLFFFVPTDFIKIKFEKKTGENKCKLIGQKQGIKFDELHKLTFLLSCFFFQVLFHLSLLVQKK